MKHNEYQKEFIEAPLDKSICLNSLFGSGKTHSILYRIKYLLDNGINPEQIILTTFTRPASNNMKMRLNKLMKKDIKLFFCGTLDSLAFKLLINNKIIDLKTKKLNKSLDVSELQFLITKHKNLLPKHIKYLIIDEANDLNQYQFEFCSYYYNEIKSNVYFIGDINQNIYQFRGSSGKYLKNFNQYFTNSSNYNLPVNYRSSKSITSLCNHFLKLNGSKILSISNNTDETIKPELKQFSNYYSMCEKIIEIIQSADCQNHNIAILSRNNKTAGSISKYLIKRKISVQLEDNEREKNNSRIHKNHIFCSTIHKSKGLEFEKVILLGLDDYYDYTLTNNKKTALCNLIYVGLSRAKKNLYIFNYGKSNFTKYIRSIPYYLVDCDDEYILNDDVETKNSKKAHKETEFKNITEILENMTPETLNKANSILDDLEYETLKSYKGYTKHYYKVEKYQCYKSIGILLDKITKYIFITKKNITQNIFEILFNDTLNQEINENSYSKLMYFNNSIIELYNYYKNLFEKIYKNLELYKNYDYYDPNQINNNFTDEKNIKIRDYLFSNDKFIGAPDIILKHKNKDKYILIEIKNSKSSTYSLQKKYFLQMLLYSSLLKEYKIHIRTCILFNSFLGDNLKIKIDEYNYDKIIHFDFVK